MEWEREYRYRSRFGGSHDDYMDTPDRVINWMLGLDQIHVRQEQQQEQQADAEPRIT